MKFLLTITAVFFLSSFSYSQAYEFEVEETIYIGQDKEFKSLEDYFTEERYNVRVIVADGDYYNEGEIYIRGENIIIEAKGKVSLFCTTLYNCVMWVTGENILIKNFHMTHLKPGDSKYQNCSGRVVLFDNASNCTVEICDLNGCGLAGVHDNLGNLNILIKKCYIHNNSLGAYTDIDGGVWQKAVDNHPVFKFENNKIENNGPDRVPEK